MAWQPIETAPKDGTSVLLVVGKRVEIGHYVDSETIDYGVKVRETKCWALDGRFISIFGGLPEPTHWMPLPEVPSDVGATERTDHGSFTQSVGSPPPSLDQTAHHSEALEDLRSG